jgi:sodium/potassium-transporting ATPase subunit alpha
MCKTCYGKQGEEDIDRFTNSYDKSNDLLARDGKRILGFACKFLDRRQYRVPEDINIKTPSDLGFDSDDFIFIGIVSLMDPPRDEVPEAVLTCRSAGIKVIMVTGDQPKTAAAIAKQVNIISRESKTSVDLKETHNMTDA